MFEWRPLPVPEDAAEAVAEDPRLWLTTIHSRLVAGGLEPGYAHLPEASLTSDLDPHAWMSEGERSEDVDPDAVARDAVHEALPDRARAR